MVAKQEPVKSDEHEPATSSSPPLIRRLSIDRFRGIKKLVWYPRPGLNVILGGGDVGKTTILDAVSLLLSPTNTAVLSDSDYWRRDVETGFCIEAVMSLPEACGINQQTKHVWPWEWDGKEPTLPAADRELAGNTVANPVYRLRVRGTPEFDVAFEIFQPDGTVDHFAAGLRRKIGLVRLSGDDRNDRDLRLIQGSALDRLLSDKTLRARLGQKLAKSDVEEELKDDAKQRFMTLNVSFQEQALPGRLSLGFTGGQGLSLNALIGLIATVDDVKLPLASWGAGTRRLAALQIAASHQSENPIVVVDEVERGLEPYRQRGLIAELQRANSQVFLTTHSAAALSAASDASIWYLDSKGAIGPLPTDVSLHRRRDPETFLARVAIVAEGPTEVGFVKALLEKGIEGDLLDRGIWITDACGNSHALKLLQALSGSGLEFGGFVDNEGRDPERWASLRTKLGPLLFQWPTGGLEENIIRLVPAFRLQELITDPKEERTGDRLRTLADRLGVADADFSTIKAAAPDLFRLIIEAAVGAVPEEMRGAPSGEQKALRRHGERWFKSVEGGGELAGKVFSMGLWPLLEKHLLPFLNAVRTAVELPTLNDLPP